MLTEFTGARGVGKSTLHHRVLAALHGRGVHPADLRAVRWSERLAHRFALLPTDLRSSSTFWRWKPRTLRDLRKFRARLIQHASRLQRIERETELAMLDEGVFQLALTLHARTAYEDMDAIVTALARWMRLPDLVVFVHAPEEVIVGRRRARGNAGDRRASRMSDSGRRALVALARTLDTMARTHTGVETLHVHMAEDTDVSAAAASVAEQLVQRMRESGRLTTTPLRHDVPIGADTRR